MYGNQIFVIDPKISAERPESGINHDLSGRLAGPGLSEVVGLAYAVLVPSLHGRTATGAHVRINRLSVRGRFVVRIRDLRHRVKHPWTHTRLVRPFLPDAKQVIGHGGQAKAGARPRRTLVQDGHADFLVVRQRPFSRHFGEGCDVHLIAKIDGVGPRVQLWSIRVGPGRLLIPPPFCARLCG